MRKSYLFLVLTFTLALSTSVFAATPPEPQYHSAEKLTSTGANQYDPYREVKLVRLADNTANGTAVVSGDAVIWDTISDDGVSIALTTTSADGAFAGIACTAIQTGDTTGATTADYVGTRNWGWVVSHGFAQAKVGAGGTNSNSAKDFFITSTDSGAITGIVNRTSNIGTTAGGLREVAAKGGFFYDAADTTSTLVDVFVEAS